MMHTKEINAIKTPKKVPIRIGSVIASSEKMKITDDIAKKKASFAISFINLPKGPKPHY
ncbi:hypothetical protein pzkkv8_18 [Klebsiella phage pzk-kv8]|jgi:hypothetical protein|nr:hypothetical protein pzkkv8_18 [Klebsiella phage pzk-kv8]